MIDLGAAASRASELNRYANNLETARGRLATYKLHVGYNWSANEVAFYNSSLERIDAELKSLSAQLNSIGTSIVSTAQTIYDEQMEEERKRLEAEAAAAAAAAAAAGKGTSGGGK